MSESATSQWLITLLTDSWGGETGWEVRNSFGLIVAIGLPGSYDSETLYEIPLELTGTGCFTFKLTDEYGDGMNGGPGVDPMGRVRSNHLTIPARR